MNIKKLKPYILFAALTEAVGALSGWLSREGIEAFEAVSKPALTPPAAVFPIVWAVLYALMGVGAARVWLAEPSSDRRRGLLFFAAQLAVNFLWSPIFFGRQAYGAAFFWLILLWALTALMIFYFYKTDKTAARLQLPYLIWLTFAGYLNLSVWLLNR